MVPVSGVAPRDAAHKLGDMIMSTKIALIAATLAASFAFAASANALTIVNKDTHKHNVRITLATAAKGDKPMEVKVDAGKSVEFDCAKGCVAHLGKKDNAKKDVVLKGTEKTLTVEADKLTAAL